MSEPGRTSRLALGSALGALMIGATAIVAAPTAPHVAPTPPPPLSPPESPAGVSPASPIDARPPLTAAEREVVRETMRAVPGEVRSALVSARATVERAPGMRDEDRRAALSSIDRAIAGLDRRRGPMPR